MSSVQLSPVQLSKDQLAPKSWGSSTMSEFFAKVRWEQACSAELKQAAKEQNWDLLKQELLPEVLGCLDPIVAAQSVSEWPWTWSPESSGISASLEPILERLRKLTPAGRADLAKRDKKLRTAGEWNEALINWLSGQKNVACSESDRLLWLDLFPLLAPHLRGEVFCQVWKKLFIEGATVAAEVLDAKSKAPQPSRETLEQAWRFSLMFWSVQGGGRVHELAGRKLEKEILEGSDAVGTPSGEFVGGGSPGISMKRQKSPEQGGDLAGWLAPFIRAAREGQRAGVPLFEEIGRQRFRQVTHRALALCSEGGEFLLSQRQVSNPQLFLQQLLKAGDESIADLLLSAFPGLGQAVNGTRGARKPGVVTAAMSEDAEFSPRNSFQSDEVRVACLRNHFPKDEAKIAIAHHSERAMVELRAGSEALLKGEWIGYVQTGTGAASKKRRRVEEPWSCTCWHSDQDAEYFEMQADLPGGGQVDRQILLPRSGHYAIFTESLTRLPAGRIDYEMRLPLGPNITIQDENRTRELRLAGKGKTARFFPLALPQFKRESTAGSITVEGNELVLRCATEGQAIFVPIVIDWDATRPRTEAQWKGLTVTENLEKVRSDIAAAYRLKLDTNHQLLMYRSLVKSFETRACLGQQTKYETMIGRVEPTGELSPLMYVD